MSTLTKADIVWNRACLRQEPLQLPGDRALAAMLLLHSLAMNGGVLHAIECLTPLELDEAAWGYRFFGFNEAAALLEGARVLVEENDDPAALEVGLDKQYATLIPDDSALSSGFELYFLRHPSEFAPT